MKDKYMSSEEALEKFREKESEFCSKLENHCGKIIPLDNFDNLNNFLKSFIFINNVKFEERFPPKINYFLVEDIKEKKVHVLVESFLYDNYSSDDNLRKIISSFPDTKYFLLGKVENFKGLWNISKESEDVPDEIIKLYYYGSVYDYKIPFFKKKKVNKSPSGLGGGLSLWKDDSLEGAVSIVE
jgi:hypothetical protein